MASPRGHRVGSVTTLFPLCVPCRLRECNLDVLGCSFLALALMSNRYLTHLSLSGNPLGDDAINLLCEVLVEASCHLQDLE